MEQLEEGGEREEEEEEEEEEEGSLSKVMMNYRSLSRG